ncbi:hypothetical protein O3M35_005283 [Rhynocoris fuscipes]|uniref:Cilia- and flagella-associated protein 47 domain-containing protein n=1 Tax=Rhynocoris fuscipes TaxID=488301 RepID=A0AAW1DN00_9HEMI
MGDEFEFKGLNVYEGISNVITLEDDDDEPEDVFGLRIKPGILIFSNPYVGQIYVKNIIFTNVSSHKVVLRILRPYSLAFKVAREGQWIFLPPGIQAKSQVSFRCTQNVSAETALPLLINGTKYEIPIYVKKGFASIRVYPTKLDFGVLDVGCPYVRKSIILENEGLCPALYAIKFGQSDLELVAFPKAGRINGHSHRVIQIEMTGFKAGEYLEEVWVKTKPLQRVLIQVIFITRSLKSIHPLTTGDFTLIDIGPTILMTERYETTIIRNVSASVMIYALLAEFDQDVMSFETACKLNSNYIHFTVTPSEGKMGPFEGRIFTISFKPVRDFTEKGWKHREDTYVKDFLAFVRVVRVEVLDSKKEEKKKTGCQLAITDDGYTLEGNYRRTVVGVEHMKKSEQIILRLCLHGVAVKPRLEVIPDELIFENVTLGSIIDKVITIKNLTHEVCLGYRYEKMPYFHVEPSMQFIQPKKCVDVLVRFKAQSLGSRQTALKLEMVSPQNLTDNTNIIAVGMVEVKLKIRLKVEAKDLKPQFNMGITPRITHEVGLHTEKMTFKKKLEGAKAPILIPKPTKNDRRAWLKSNDSIAFPNDRSRTLAEKPYDKRMVTPYTGKRRYIPPPIKEYTLEKKTAQDWKLLKDNYTAYLAKLGKDRRNALMSNEKFVNAYNYSLEQRLFNKKHMYDDVKEQPFVACNKTVFHYNYICPLNPIALFNIKVNPKTIDFGKIPPKVDVSCTFLVENLNTFPVSVKLSAEKSTIILPEKAFIVGANSATSIEIMINIRIYGKHFSNMNYIINNNHPFDMKITAEVVRRSLTVEPTSVTFSKPTEIYQNNFAHLKIKNPLSVPTAFYWKQTTESTMESYYVEPRSGTVPGLCTISCTIYFDYNAKSLSAGSVTLVAVKGSTVTVQCNYINEGSTVCSFHPKLFCPNISLGLESIEEIVLFNPSYYDNIFSINDTNPYEGVIVRPKSGVIKSRTGQIITLLMNINKVTEFDFKIIITLNGKVRLECKVYGYVLYPNVVFKPEKVSFRDTPCLSFSTAAIEMTNMSNARALVNFAMENHFQMKISSSENIRDAGLTDEGILLPPNKSEEIFLHFLPTELSSYDFILPVIINKLIGPPSIDNPSSLKLKKYIKFGHTGRISVKPPKTINTVVIECTMSEGILVFSHTELNFIIERGERGIQLFKIRNEFNKNVNFWFNIPLGPFSIKRNNTNIKALNIKAKEEIVLRAIFNPAKPDTYIANVNVYIKLDGEIKLHNVLKLTGIFHKSSLYCAENLLYYLPVPLDVEVEKSVHIVANHQYKPTQLSYTVYSTTGEIFEGQCISCIYPKGKQLPVTSGEFIVPVKITFKSSKPMSYLGIVKFSDGLEGSCKVGVCVTSENCTLTTHAYKYFRKEYIDVPQINRKSGSESEIGFERSDSFKSISDTAVKIVRKKEKGKPKQPQSCPLLLNDEFDETTSGNYEYCERSARVGVMRRSLTSQEVSEATYGSVGCGTEDSYACNLDSKNNIKTETDFIKNQKVAIEIDEYPMFPSPTSNTPYARYMRRVEQMVEQWVYQQAFQCSYRFTVGLDLYYTNAFQSSLNSKSKSIYHSDIKSLKDLITKLAGKEFELAYFVPSVVPTDNTERVEYIINAYKQIITFLKIQGALMIHVFPVHLLIYNDYIIYYKELRNKPDPSSSPIEHEVKTAGAMLDKGQYERVCHQSWLDLFLQIYKVLAFHPIYTLLKGTLTNLGVNCRINATVNVDRSDQETSTTSFAMKHDRLTESLLENTDKMNKEYSKAEIILKNWLNYIFEAKRNAWNAKDLSINLPERYIANFTSDLEDGVVLTAATTYYCPYLTKLLGEIYFKPNNSVQYYHNNVLLTNIWRNMRLGLTIFPVTLEKPDEVIMIFIVAHLYHQLRTYVPKTLLKMNACLSSTMKRTITIMNPSTGQIKFIVNKVGDPNDHFTLSTNNVIKIRPQKTIDVTISYEAKRLFRATGMLMFCGSCQSGNFANNFVFELEGEASQLEIKDHYCFSVPIYKPTLINVKCTSPYLEDAVYELWYTEHEPKPGKIIMYNWNSIKKRKIPRMIHLGCSSLMVPSVHAQPSSLPLVVASCKMEEFEAWIIFTNEKTGDFIVKVTVMPRHDYIHTVFDVDLPYANCLNVPTLLCTAACPRQVKVVIPTRNSRFWETLKTMLYFTLDENEKMFWSAHFETPVGLQLIKWLLSEIKEPDTKQIISTFKTRVVYDLECDSQLVEFLPTLTIPDIHAKEDTTITFHVRKKVNESFSAKLMLKSQDNSDVRVYKINFNLTNPPPSIIPKKNNFIQRKKESESSQVLEGARRIGATVLIRR